MSDFPTVQNVWGPGSHSPTRPGPQAEPGEDAACACLGDEQYSGFVGDDQEADTLYATG